VWLGLGYCPVLVLPPYTYFSHGSSIYPCLLSVVPYLGAKLPAVKTFLNSVSKFNAPQRNFKFEILLFVINYYAIRIGSLNK
jgi:hypothetical protein